MILMDSVRQGDLDALKRVHSFLSGCTEGIGEIPVVFDADKSIAEAFSVEDIEHAVNYGLLRYPYIGMVRNGEQVHPDKFTADRRVARTNQRLYVNASAVEEQFNNGASIILKGVEEWNEPVRAVVEEMGRILGTRVKADVFYTPAGSQALAVHRDEYHVFAVQLHGQKNWMLQGLPQDASWRGGPATQESLLPPRHIELKTGQAMFLERGMAHSASAQDSPSAHISFVVRTFRLSEQLERVVADIVRDEVKGFTSLDAGAVRIQMGEALELIKQRMGLLNPDDLAVDAVDRLEASSHYGYASFT